MGVWRFLLRLPSILFPILRYFVHSEEARSGACPSVLAVDAGVPEVDDVVIGCGEDIVVGVMGTNGGKRYGVDVESGDGLRRTMIVYDGDEGELSDCARHP